MTLCSVMKPMTRISDPQRGHTNGSISYDLVSHCTPRSGFGQLWLILLW